ncbi:NAD(P)/FAD-dependent oxidoreductase [Anaerostipes sp.]|uniref:NAD(P)/FAD-dependent oxidoreductase n=1 Tax=Anaerostipes sp. TaxID=1872530 RepID=UPI0025BEBB75|nr:NAD(P)/FAD-dependent oxidoreductase [Anaerostipes sp.]MBS7008048.1 NAD(P)/FAD-dependent oxidoreductase [Anaerostipes sp.]
MKYDVIIAGGGASGMTAAITAAHRGCSVLVLERMDKLGKKILATGNGRCNLTNSFLDQDCYRGEKPGFPYSMLEEFGAEQTLDFFQSMGMLASDVEGYYYPASMQAATVVDTLAGRMKSLGIDVKTGAEVEEIKKVRETFHVKCGKDRYQGRNIILAAGGMAQEKLGSNGSGYRLAKSLGHTVTDLFPALVALESSEPFFKHLAGVRNVCSLSVYVNGQKTVSQEGEVQFTKYGISGIPVFQVSRYAIDALRKKKKVEVILNLMPEQITLKEMMDYFRKVGSYKTAEEFLWGFMNKKLAFTVLSRLKIHPETSVKDLGQKEMRQIRTMIQKFTVPVSGYKGFDMAQVTAGGVSVREVVEGTLESKIHRGLYFTGEILDVDGTCGGYNLQWAFTSGYIAGNQIKAVNQ